MIQVVWCSILKAEYEKLFRACVVKSAQLSIVDKIVNRIKANQSKYVPLAKEIGCPWFVIGLIHYMEAGLSFEKHLHNGDPLTARTKRVPMDRPKEGEPPFTWEASARDALYLLKYNEWKDWSIGGILWKLESYNGLGYRQYHPNVLTPYLWSMTNHYVKGKYVKDGKFDPNCVSLQIGTAAILKRAVELGVISL